MQGNIYTVYIYFFLCLCDEWGGAESRGNGARPVELMMMSYTCTTHRSRVPRRSSGRIKGGVTTVEDERGPGLDLSRLDLSRLPLSSLLLLSFRSSSVGLETGEWCRCSSSSLTPPASLRSHGSRPHPTHHSLFVFSMCFHYINSTFSKPFGSNVSCFSQYCLILRYFVFSIVHVLLIFFFYMAAMSINNLILKFCSWNVRGVQNPIKRKKILNYLKKEKFHIAFLQETHLTADEHTELKRDWVGQMFCSSFSKSSTHFILGGLLTFKLII